MTNEIVKDHCMKCAEDIHKVLERYGQQIRTEYGEEAAVRFMMITLMSLSDLFVKEVMDAAKEIFEPSEAMDLIEQIKIQLAINRR